MAAAGAAQFALYENMFPNDRYVLVRLNGQVQGINVDPDVAGIRNWIQGGMNDRVIIEVPPQLHQPPNPQGEQGG